MAQRDLVVQASFPAPRPTTNPYIVMLADALRATPGIELRLFSWKSALLGRYDVFHVHWPEVLIRGTSPAKSAARLALTALLLLKLRVTRTPIVRTAHNLASHEEATALQRAVLAAFDRQTALWIALNPETLFARGQVSEVILHGHYRNWYRTEARAPSVPGRLAFVGLIRPYKNVDGLLRAFAKVPDPSLSLEIAGSPSADVRPIIEELTAGDARVEASLSYVSDDELRRIVGESELIVLPYREMHNSGVVLMALSLDRPVLAPRTPTTARLAEEVGSSWILTFDDDLTAAALESAIATVRDSTRPPHPDLSQREWTDAGPRHLAAYRRAISAIQERTPQFRKKSAESS